MQLKQENQVQQTKQLRTVSDEDMLIYKIYFFNELEKVGLRDEKVYYKHDKSFKFILASKEEMARFLSGFLGVEIENEKLEEQKTSFINEHFKKSESDIIYKIKDTEIYFLIEHQSRVDKSMPERILKYSLALRDAIKRNAEQKNTKDSIRLTVVPIVVYTGSKKWNVGTDFCSLQINKEEYQKYKLNQKYEFYKEFLIKQKYKLVDVNQYSKQELINKNTKMSNMLIIEKCNTKEELIKTLLDLVKITEDKKMLKWLEKVVRYILPDMLGEEKDMILENIRRKEVGNMEYYDNGWCSRITRNEKRKEARLIRKGRNEGIIEGKIEGKMEGKVEGKKEGKREGRKEGRKEGILEIIKNMLKLNQDEKTIMKFTNAKQADIEQAKKELQML